MTTLPRRTRLSRTTTITNSWFGQTGSGSGVCRNATVQDNHVSRVTATSNPLNTHGPAEYITFEDNDCYGGVVSVRGQYITARGNRCFGGSQPMENIELTFGSYDLCHVKNNVAKVVGTDFKIANLRNSVIKDNLP